jgi:hypothetical protein
MSNVCKLHPLQVAKSKFFKIGTSCRLWILILGTHPKTKVGGACVKRAQDHITGEWTSRIVLCTSGAFLISSNRHALPDETYYARDWST